MENFPLRKSLVDLGCIQSISRYCWLLRRFSLNDLMEAITADLHSVHSCMNKVESRISSYRSRDSYQIFGAIGAASIMGRLLLEGGFYLEKDF